MKDVVAFILTTYLLAGTLDSLAAESEQKTPYQRLVETRLDYQKAILSKDSIQIAEMCYRMGKRYIGITNYLEALKWFQQSLNIRERYGPSADLAKVYTHMSECSIYLEDSAKQYYYGLKAVENFESIGTKKAKMMSLRLKAGLFTFDVLGKSFAAQKIAFLDTSILYYNQSLQLAKDLNSTLDVALTHEFLGSIYFQKGDTFRGISHFQTAVSVYESINRWQNISDTYTGAAMLFLNLKQPDKAKPFLDLANSAASQASPDRGPDQYPALIKAFAIYYRQIKDWKNAYIYQTQLDAYTLRQKELFRKNATEGLASVYESEKKDLILEHKQKELTLLNQRQQDQETIIQIVSLLLIMACLAGILYWKLYRKHRELSIQNKNLIDEQSHRVSNNLQSLSDFLGLRLMGLTDPTMVSILSESLTRIETISLIHKQLYHSHRADTIDPTSAIPELISQILFSQDCKNIKLSFNIENLLIEVDQATILLLIINELTTNSCKYALEDNSELSIDLQMKNSTIYLDFKDQGPGFEPDVNHASFGLKMIELLTKKLNGRHIYNDQGRHFHLFFTTSKKTIKYSDSSLLHRIKYDNIA